MEKIAAISLAPPSNEGGAEIVWKNIRENIDFDNYYIKSKSGEYVYYKIPNILHINEILSSGKIWRIISTKDYKIIFYDKIFGCFFKKNKAIQIAYAQGLYTPAGLTFYKKNFIVYLFSKIILAHYEKKSYENADLIIAVSQSVKNELIKLFKINEQKIIVINNGVNPEIFKRLPPQEIKKLKQKYNLSNKRINILFPARPSYGKGFDIILKIAKKFESEINVVVLSTKKYNQKNIIPMSKIPYEKMNELYNVCDFIVFPSRYEGNSLALLEAGACQKAILSSENGALKTDKQYIENYICYNVNDYYNKIKLFLKDKEEIRKSENSWFLFSKKYPLSEQITKLKKTIQRFI